MPTVRANDLDIAFDWHGPDNGPVIVLIMGLGLPSTAWPPRLATEIVAAGFRVLTFDNRDSGQSTVFDKLPTRNVLLESLRYALHMRVRAPYQLADMAADVAALMSKLGVESAHLAGVSMGGMIAQCMAIQWPSRVLSLTSIMSTTGERRLPGPSARIRRLLLRSPRRDSTEVRIAHFRKLWKLLKGPGYAEDEAQFDALIARVFARGMPADGPIRQVLAIAAAADRAAGLRNLRVPTRVIHGDCDPMLPLECGRRTAELIPQGELRVIEGLGHTLPEALVPDLASLIVEQAQRASPMRDA